MAGVFGQFYVHVIFSPKNRANVIREVFREELQMYMTGIIQGKKNKVLAIYCMPDHVHVLIGLRPAMALAELVQVLKKESSNFINEKKWVVGKFSWQEGYGFFSHSHAELDKVIQYILNQKNITQSVLFRMNTWRFCNVVRWILKRSICLNGFLRMIKVEEFRLAKG